MRNIIPKAVTKKFKVLAASNHQRSLIIVFLFLTSVLIRLPLYHTEFIRISDSAEYYNLARNIASGNGYIKTIKVNFFDQIPVISSGIYLRPIFAPLIYAFALMIFNNVYFLQLFNLFLGALNVLLFYFLIANFIKNKFAFLAALIIALNPYILIQNRFITSDQLFYFLVLLFFIAYYRIPENKFRFVSMGVVAGLAFLTRPEARLLLIVLFVFNFRKKLWLIISLLSFLLITLPVFTLNYLVTGNPLYSSYAYVLSIDTYFQGTSYFYKPLPTASVYIQSHLYIIIGKAFATLKTALSDLLSLKYLSFLSFNLILINYRQLKNFKTFFPIILFTSLLFVFETTSWAIAYEPDRHLALIFVFIILLLFSVLSKITNKLTYLFISLTIIVYFLYDIHGILWLRNNSGFFVSKNSPAISWIKQNTDKNEIFATRDPASLYIYTLRPSILIPVKLPEAGNNDKVLKDYIGRYQIKYFFTTSNDLADFLDRNGVLKYKYGGEKVFCVTQCN